MSNTCGCNSTHGSSGESHSINGCQKKVVPSIALLSNIYMHLHSIRNSLHDCIELGNHYGIRTIICAVSCTCTIFLHPRIGIIFLSCGGGSSTCCCCCCNYAITTPQAQFLHQASTRGVWKGEWTYPNFGCTYCGFNESSLLTGGRRRRR
uniref:Uncharacterized protein n=1 Tax=Rhizophora mucronata TaxID=61149 RepID=A0A2P2Q4I8_RHIMU